MKKAALHTFDTCVSMLSEESNQRPKFLTVLDGFTNELPTCYARMSRPIVELIVIGPGMNVLCTKKKFSNVLHVQVCR